MTETIIGALEKWVAGHPEPDKPLLAIDGSNKSGGYSPREERV